MGWGLGGAMSGEPGDEVAHFCDPGAGAGDHGDYRHFELACEFEGVHLCAIFTSDIDHVECDEDGVAQLDHLDGIVEIAFEVGGIHHEHDEIGGGDVGAALPEDVAGDGLIGRLGAEAIRTGEVEDIDFEVGGESAQASFFTFYRDAGIITDLGAEAGERVKEGCFAAVRVAGEYDQVVRFCGGGGGGFEGGRWIAHGGDGLGGVSGSGGLADEDEVRLMSSEGEVGASNFDFEGVAEGGGAYDFDGGSDDEAEFHESEAGFF